MNAPLWFYNLLFWSAQVAALALAASLLVRLLRIHEPRALLLHWRTLLFACLLLPFIEPWHRLQPASAISFTPTASLPDIVSASAPASSHWPLFSMALLTEIIAAVILLGIAFRLVTLALGLVKLRQLRRASAPIPVNADSAPILEQAQSLTATRAEFRVSAQVDSPVTFGFSAPIVLLPERFLQLEPQSQLAITSHELLHVRRHDWTHHLAEEILRALLWFHPAILWLVARIRLSREQFVDLEVVRLTDARKIYLEALLEFTNSPRRIAAIPAPPFLAERQLIERISLMLKEVRMSRTRLIASLSVVASCLAACAVLAVLVFPLKAAPRTAAQASSSALAAKPVVAADTIWTDHVKRGDMPIEVAGIGTLVPARNSNELIAEVLISGYVAHEVRAGQHALVDTGKGTAKGHVTSLGSPDRNGNLWLDITPDSPLPQGSVANASIRAFISVGKLQDVIYIGRPAGALAVSANAGMPLFKLTQSGNEAVRVEVAFGRASATNIQILSGLQPGDTVILSDMSPYTKFSRIQIKR